MSGDRVRESRVLQTAAALALRGTSLAVALSPAIHFTLVRIRISRAALRSRETASAAAGRQ